ncbi:unnamed protein product [Mycena citricolor]|uniref:Uncharacterized protein n=1 Tax=Mycena citricolor TaxID=2018698 RepID=A0AAD2H0W6_9AGAR|nr:unnamed protein product [Mycena citricolor]
MKEADTFLFFFLRQMFRRPRFRRHASQEDTGHRIRSPPRFLRTIITAL